MFLILLSLSSYLASAGIEYLGFDLTITWTYLSDDEIEFELSVPLIYREALGWVGIALQDARDARDKFKCDYYIAPLDTGLMTDRYAEANGFSKTDVNQGCKNDLVVSSSETEKYLLIKFSRKLKTGDRCDIDLHKDKPIMIKYAIGPMIDGNIEQHSFRFNGLEYIILSEDYEDTNNDERFVYGPWMVKQFQDEKWYDEYGSPAPPETAFPN